jgi:phosphoenolpyruvate synthase/pyruvate phosphate dikinase
MPITNLKNARDIQLFGGKAKQLAELLQLGLNVPDGYVVSTVTIERWNDLVEMSILRHFDDFGIQYAAVRSSATVEDGSDTTWAGQFDSFMFVERDQLIRKIKSCVKSIQSARSTAYCRATKTQVGAFKIAVIVQTMVPAEVSGVCFSVHPVTLRKDHLVIEAAYGLGESVVAGHVTPDNYVVSRQTHGIIRKTVANQTKYLGFSEEAGETTWQKTARPTDQKLDKSQIKELASLVEHVEDHFGYPVDVEWALYKGKFYILQSRPITTLR